MPYKDFAVGEVLSSADVDQYLMSQTIARVTSSTRPSSPSSGQRIWETDTGREMIYSGGSWMFYRGMDIFMVKPVDESLASSNTIQDDDHFTNIPFEANATYAVTFWILATASASANWNFRLTRQTGTTVAFQWNTSSPHTSVPDADHVTVSYNVLGNPDGSGNNANVQAFGNIIYPFKLLLRSTTAGTFKLQWSQTSVFATPNVVKAGSLLHAKRVA